jgi:hypothetical protein
MLQYDLYLVQEALDASQWRRRGSEDWALRSALRLYRQAWWQGWWRRMRSALTRRSLRLFRLADVTPRQARPGHGSVRTQTVPISKIRGSAGRSNDFDNAFCPLQRHSQRRWLSIAMARRMGAPLPPVELIQIGDIYFVRDGHHRISVAQALGQQEIDSEVTVWHITGPLAWERTSGFDTQLWVSQQSSARGIQ